MNRNIALSLVIASAAVAAPAFADDPTVVNDPFVSSVSRASVIAEMQQARQAGGNPWADDYNPIAQFRSGRTRAEVTSEYMLSRDMVSALGGEDSGSAYLARRDAPQARDIQLAATPVADEE